MNRQAFAATFADHHVLPDINFNRNYLINNISILKKVIINIYLLNHWPRNLNAGFTLGSCAFGSAKLRMLI